MRSAITLTSYFLLLILSLDTIKYSTCQTQQLYGYDENELTLNITLKGTM